MSETGENQRSDCRVVCTTAGGPGKSTESKPFLAVRMVGILTFLKLGTEQHALAACAHVQCGRGCRLSGFGMAHPRAHQPIPSPPGQAHTK